MPRHMSIVRSGNRVSQEAAPRCFHSATTVVTWKNQLLLAGARGLDALRGRDVEWAGYGVRHRFGGVLVGADRLHDCAGRRRHQRLLLGSDASSARVDRVE